MLRVRMKNRETVFHLNVAKRDAKAAAVQHVAHWGRETVPSGRKDDRGKDVYARRDIPPEEFLFFWVENEGTPEETEEPITLG